MTNKIRHVRSGFVAVCRGFNDLRRVLTALSIAGGSMLDDRATAALCTQFFNPSSSHGTVKTSIMYTVRSLAAIHASEGQVSG